MHFVDGNNSIHTLTQQDLGTCKNNVGANGMTAEQMIRAAIIKQIGGYTRTGNLLLCDASPDGPASKVADVAAALGVTSRTVEQLKREFVKYSTH